MMMTRKLLLVPMAALVFSVGAIASAAPLFTFYVNEPAGNAAPNEQVTIGNEFTVGATALNVSHLGAYIVPALRDQNGDSTVPYVVQLFDKTGADTGTFLGEVTVPAGTAVDATGFAYVPYVTTLAANQGYILTNYGISGGVVQTGYSYTNQYVSAGTFGPYATFVKNRYYGYPPEPGQNIGGTDFPFQNTAAYEQFMGGNALVTPVPEPSGLALLAFGMVSLYLFRGKRR